jgi:hypothetical protein
MRRVLVATIIVVGCGTAETGRSEEGAQKPSEAVSPSSVAPDELIRNSYRVAYELCSHANGDGVYREAGTRDVREAAVWYSKGSQDGPHRDASYRGCLAGLTKQTKEY